jgi:hypothetical protein
MDPPAGGAIKLEYNKSIDVLANDMQTIYAFQKTWRKATSFVGTKAFEMQISNSHLFDSSTSFVGTYTATLFDGVYTIDFTSAEMQVLTARARDNYLYVRFNVSSPVTVTPQLWNISECLDKTQLIQIDRALPISSSTNANTYRIIYDDIKGYNLKIQWKGSGRMAVFFADTCAFAMSSSMFM